MEEETSKVDKTLYYLIDAMFWLADETSRWWEIGKISIDLHALRRQKAALNKQIKENELNSISISVAQTAELASLNESILKLSTKDDFIRSKCWAYSPEIVFALLFMLFFYGVLTINPIQKVVDYHKSNTGIFAGKISRVREIGFTGHSIITDSAWYNNSLYIAGNNGITEIDTSSGITNQIEKLPKEFFGKFLKVHSGKLIIAGYPGIFHMENSEITPLFEDNKLPYNLINCFAYTTQNQMLLGTLGQGILKSKKGTAVMLPKTQRYIVKDFGSQKKELWVLHDEGILIGDPEHLTALELQVLSGKNPRCMATTDKNIFIGTDQGVVAGFRSPKSWVWTMLSSTNPGVINDIISVGEVLFIASDEGVFRYYKGKMDRLSSIPTHTLCICDSFLAATSKSSVLLYYFDITSAVDNNSIFGAVPELGTYTANLPHSSILAEKRIFYGKMPDYGLLEADGQNALGESALITGEYSPTEKPMIQLPMELQKPVFSDTASLNGKYYLATTNRGIWSFDGEAWNQINTINNKQANRLCYNDEHCYAYSEEAGISEIVDNNANQVVVPAETKSLKRLSLSEEDTLLLLYQDNKVKVIEKDKEESLFTVPSDLKDSCHSVWKIDNKYVAVTNQGVMTNGSNGDWNLVFFQGNIDSASIADVKLVNKSELYIALNDGRIFTYSKEKLSLSGIVPDHPVAINYSNVLWVSSKDSLYYKENNSFVAAPLKSNDKVLGAFPAKDGKKVYVFTASGLRQF